MVFKIWSGCRILKTCLNKKSIHKQAPTLFDFQLYIIQQNSGYFSWLILQVFVYLRYESCGKLCCQKDKIDRNTYCSFHWRAHWIISIRNSFWSIKLTGRCLKGSFHPCIIPITGVRRNLHYYRYELSEKMSTFVHCSLLVCDETQSYNY